MIAGLELPTAGKFSWAGRTSLTCRRPREISPPWFFSLMRCSRICRCKKTLLADAVNSGMGRDEIAERTSSGMDLVGLKGFEKRLPSELSGGQQQRVAVARAIVLEPQVLLFDEPLSNLDAKLRRQVREENSELQIGLGLTVVYVTHDQEEALAVSDKIVVMDKAKIAQIGTPVDLYDRPNSVFVADFIGEANILDCDVLSLGESESSVRIDNYQFAVGNVIPEDREARLAVRPRNITLSSESNRRALRNCQESVLCGQSLIAIVGTFGEVFSYRGRHATPQVRG